MKSHLKIVSINRTPEHELATILMEKWKRKQEKELQDLISGKTKIKSIKSKK